MPCYNSKDSKLNMKSNFSMWKSKNNSLLKDINFICLIWTKQEYATIMLSFFDGIVSWLKICRIGKKMNLSTFWILMWFLTIIREIGIGHTKRITTSFSTNDGGMAKLWQVINFIKTFKFCPKNMKTTYLWLAPCQRFVPRIGNIVKAVRVFNCLKVS